MEQAIVTEEGTFFLELAEEARNRPEAFRYLGSDAAPIARCLEVIERRTRHELWNAQPSYSLRAVLLAHDATARSHDRGVSMRYMVPRTIAEANPLAVCISPHVRVANVHHPMLIPDRAALVFRGPSLSGTGAATAFLTTRPRDVSTAVSIYERLWETAVPAVPEGRMALFTPRQASIALLSIQGCTYQAIGRKLAISVRTVAADMNAICLALDAPSPVSAIAMLAGSMPHLPRTQLPLPDWDH